MKTRDYRRSKKETIKNKIKKRLDWHYGYVESVGVFTKGYDERDVGILATTPKICSLPGCCGNPRKFFGATIQEKKDRRISKESIDEFWRERSFKKD